MCLKSELKPKPLNESLSYTHINKLTFAILWHGHATICIQTKRHKVTCSTCVTNQSCVSGLARTDVAVSSVAACSTILTRMTMALDLCQIEHLLFV